MDINNKEDNLITEQGKIELKDAENFPENDKDNSQNENKIEDIPKEVLTYNKPKGEENDDNKRKKSYSDELSDAGQPIGKQAMETMLLNLNSYWLELIGSISLVVSVFIYEMLGFVALSFISPLFGSQDYGINDINVVFNFIVQTIGLKWLIFIQMSQHLSIGFFCLTTFSNVFNETQNIKKFYITNCIKVVLFYAISVIILKVLITDGIGGFIENKINEAKNTENFNVPDEKLDQIKELFDKLIDKLAVIIANFLATFNTFIEKLMLGTLYITLLEEPKALSGKKMIYFRLLSIIPILYMIISIVFRALQTGEVLVVSEYISPLLLGPKISVYCFFVSTIATIKYKSLAYNVYDDEGYLDPKVFTKIGSKMFAIFAMIEMIIGLFKPSWTFVGIGSKYLMILCAPIMTLYDYKKKNEVHLPCCKSKDFSKCIKISFNVIGYTLIVLMGIVLASMVLDLFGGTMEEIFSIIADNWDWALEIASLFI